jgi:two-component system sensor histidine kinase KdpD
MESLLSLFRLSSRLEMMRTFLKQNPVLKKVCLGLIFFCVIALITRIALQLGAVVNPTTVGFSFLIVVLLSAVFAGVEVAIGISIIATLLFNYFFFPPVGTFHIDDFDNWVAVIAFSLTAIVISRLTASAHENARKAEELDRALEGLTEFNAWLLSVPHDLITLTGIAENAVRILHLEYCSIHVYAEGKWHHFTGNSLGGTTQRVAKQLKITEDHPTTVMELAEEQGLDVRYAQVRTGPKSFTVVAVKSKDLPTQAIHMMASMIAILLTQALLETSESKLESNM